MTQIISFIFACFVFLTCINRQVRTELNCHYDSEHLAYSCSTDVENYDVSTFIDEDEKPGIILELDASHCSIHDLNSKALSDCCVDLTKLNLAHNSLSSVNGIFANLSSLISLNLSQNQISAINDKTFASLDNLKELDLRENTFSIARDSGAFKNLKKLNMLMLSHNKLLHLKSVIGKACSLYSLSVSHAGLIPSDDDFCSQGSLKYLTITHNTKPIGFESIKKQSGLRSVDLSHNAIEDLDEDAFFLCTRLNVLNLSHNLLTSLGRGSFAANSDLKELDLSHNALQTINEEQFAKNTKLRNLRLNDNRLDRINEALFKNLVDLHNLDLSGNFFRQLPERLFFENRRLLSLRLASNRLSSVHERAFSTLSALVELDLCDNRLSQLSDAHFLSLENLRSVALCRNRLKKIPDGLAKASRRKLSIVDASCNELHDPQSLRTLLDESAKGATFAFGGNPISCSWLDETIELAKIKGKRIKRNGLFDGESGSCLADVGSGCKIMTNFDPYEKFAYCRNGKVRE